MYACVYILYAVILYFIFIYYIILIYLLVTRADIYHALLFHTRTFFFSVCVYMHVCVCGRACSGQENSCQCQVHQAKTPSSAFPCRPSRASSPPPSKVLKVSGETHRSSARRGAGGHGGAGDQDVPGVPPVPELLSARGPARSGALAALPGLGRPCGPALCLPRVPAPGSAPHDALVRRLLTPCLLRPECFICHTLRDSISTQ